MQSEGSSHHAFVYSAEMVDFVTASNSYCHFLEQSAGEDGKPFITNLVQILPQVYATFVKLGENEPVNDPAIEPAVTEQEWALIYHQVANTLGPYNETLRPAEEEEFDRSELVRHTVSEDLADLYQELKDFTRAYSRGLEDVMNDAAWELRERFSEHWGKKLLRSLASLHELYVTGVDPSEES
jgi:hypothetical protein